MNHIKISIEVEETDQERLIALLSQLHVTGFEQTPTLLLAYFEEATYSAEAVAELLGPLLFKVETIKEQNWNEVWESNFEPVVIPGFCGVRAHFHQAINDVAHEIVITPKMSFGTGHHATTYMMMEHMKDMDLKDKTVFDFGTGTGILAILAEKLGARHIHAIDVDAWSVTNTIENAANNLCENISVEQTTVLPQHVYDVVLANINRNIILEYLPGLERILHNAGLILFSGLMEDDEGVIHAACSEQGLVFLRKKVRTKWISLLFHKGN
jgi:ribosomal protein L11 methyltransferase